MANVFTRTNDATPTPNRNTFDLSFVNNMTLKAGVITPCFLKEVMPGDSAQIDATFGFNFQPMVFPVQTDMQANLHFFYVRNRTLWKGWQDFITKQENLDGDSTPPYIQLTDENRDMFETGKIGDYLGVPTVYYGSKNEYHSFKYSNKVNIRFATPFYGTLEWYDEQNLQEYGPLLQGIYSNYSNSTLVKANLTDLYNGALFTVGNDRSNTYHSVSAGHKFVHMFQRDLAYGSYSVTMPSSGVLFGALSPGTKQAVSGGNFVVSVLLKENEEDGRWSAVAYGGVLVNNDGTSTSTAFTHNWQRENDTQFLFDPSFDPHDIHRYRLVSFYTGYVDTAVTMGLDATFTLYSYVDARNGIQNSDRLLSELPFASNYVDEDGTSPADKIRISALPFRAVEAVYNSFYRDDRNNPLMIDGKPYYNVWVQNQTGGADTTHYHLYKRNWEADVFTTAVQSPSQGILPLVGVTATGNMTFSDENGKTYFLQAELADDGTIEGISSYSSDMPSGTLRAMVDTISTGISINDFRNVNAFQRWLEVGMRKGLRYKDNIEAHFGTAPTYSELDMPEFIGGMSRKVQMNRVVQSVDDAANDKPLGTLGGYATVLGDGGQKISKYFDEHGWIIGFITITPKPVYSQQLNKQLLKTELLDHYFPEFAHISMQPILNKELAPLQCSYGSSDVRGLNGVFGYQRAWYEYLSSVDEVHGDFRTSMRKYLIQRLFNGVPQLGEEFLTVGDEEVNAVFAVEKSDEDNIFGQLYFDVKMKRPIPAIGIPKLEA